MTRQEWNEFARALGKARAAISATWPPKGIAAMDAAVAHDRKLIYFATLDGFDKAVRAVCVVLRGRSRFDSDRFMRLIGIP